MQSHTYPITATGTLYRDARGNLLGAVYAITGHGGLAHHVTETHDWANDRPGGAYRPVHAGTYRDLQAAVDTLEARARQAQAPDTINTDPYASPLAWTASVAAALAPTPGQPTVLLTGISSAFTAEDIECLVRTAAEALCGPADDLSSRQIELAHRAYALLTEGE